MKEGGLERSEFQYKREGRCLGGIAQTCSGYLPGLGQQRDQDKFDKGL